MPLTKYGILTGYMTSRDLISRPDAAVIWRRLINRIDDALLYHASSHNWKFRRGTETLTTDSNVYVDSTTLSSIKGASFEGVGDLDLISEAQYNSRTKINTETSNTPEAVYINGARIYPCLKPTSGLSIDVWGLLNIANAAAVLAVLPDNHEPLMRYLFDAYEGIAGIGIYESAASSMYQQENIGRAESAQVDRFWSDVDASIGT